MFWPKLWLQCMNTKVPFIFIVKLEKEDDWFPQGNPKEINMDMYLDVFVH